MLAGMNIFKEDTVMNRDLTNGNVTGSLLVFAGPMILGNLLQQCYNIVDTWVVGDRKSVV